MSHALPLPAGARRKPGVSRGILVILALCVAGGTLAVGLVLSILWPRWPGAVTAPGVPELPISIGGVTFNIPPGAIRVPVQRRPGAQERVDLSFAWPALTPPGPAPKHLAGEPPVIPDHLFVSIGETTGSLPPAERLKLIYPRYIDPQPIAGPDGLYGATFRDGTPYQGEDLFMDTTAPDRFTARCTRPGRGTVTGTCLVERRIGGAAFTARFPRDWLSDWRAVSAGIDRLIAALRPAGS